jgi:hypothetical protein
MPSVGGVAAHGPRSALRTLFSPQLANTQALITPNQTSVGAKALLAS